MTDEVLLTDIASVRNYVARRREELLIDRKEFRERGDTMEAYAATDCILELGWLLRKLPENDA